MENPREGNFFFQHPPPPREKNRKKKKNTKDKRHDGCQFNILASLVRWLPIQRASTTARGYFQDIITVMGKGLFVSEEIFLYLVGS